MASALTQVSLCSTELFGQVVFTDSPEPKEQLCSHKDRKYRPVWEGPGPSCLGDLSGTEWAQCLEVTRESRGVLRRNMTFSGVCFPDKLITKVHTCVCNPGLNKERKK